MSKAPLREQIAYKFDTIMSRGLLSLIWLLGLVTFLFVGTVSAVVSLFQLYPPGNSFGYLEVFWGSLLRTLDPGTMGQDQGIGYRGAMLVVTISGLILVASLIGIISNSFNAKVEELRKGKSRVLEKDHTLILGWNSKIFSLIHELSIANESRKKPVIVIMSMREKVQMEDEIRAKLKHQRNTRIVIRSGDPMSLHDLEIVNPQSARSIVILSSDEDADADSMSIKTCLAIVNQKGRSASSCHIVGEIRNTDNLDAAKIVGGDEAHWIVGDRLISGLVVQTSRQSGLSAVFTELLDFEGSEMYETREPDLVGKTFGEASLAFSKGCLMGMISESRVVLNPPSSQVISESDVLVVLAEDDSQIRIGSSPTHEVGAITGDNRPPKKPENTLVLGYSKNINDVLSELTEVMMTGSEVRIVCEFDFELNFSSDDLKVTKEIADHTSRQVLEGLGIEKFDHILLLADRENFSIQGSDARTLITLLQIRDIASKKGVTPNVVSEMVDDRNRELADGTSADDFIVSDNLVSLMIAQLSENPRISRVFESLLSSEGSEIRLHPAEWYVEIGKPVNFNAIVASASQQAETALGISILSPQQQGRLFGVNLNPDRDQIFILEKGDRIVVLTNE
jgi:voltage-gated potassium channel Kch